MDDETPASAKDAAKVAFGSSIIIVILLLIGIIWYFARPKNIVPATTARISPTAAPIVSPVVSTASPTTAPSGTGVQEYASPRLKVSFRYNTVQESSNEHILVKEAGNKINIYPSSLPEGQGQSIEVFDKTANETVEDAIRREFLSGKDLKRCLITTRQEGSRTIAEITFPTSQNEDVDAFFKNTTYCSENYAQTNGLRYFLYDPAVPTKFYFLSIGQYAIQAENGAPWQNTLRVFN